ncbi:hypothetical protein OS493_023728 [Desmophyllum pertusum]|uniref:Uncharacterized protein n=1 Tax=Desmophyllum pertusum TaxID=174260 RepID=A0A9X0CPY1_9CNID|nr:hypothetical protein OS493_023728 [Desmophyllum pertusum]
MRVKSRITGSFFKKGRKDDTKTPRELASFQSTTFSGYLLRKKDCIGKIDGVLSKSTLCSATKTFGIGTAEPPGSPPWRLDKKRWMSRAVDVRSRTCLWYRLIKEEVLFAAENDV